MDDTHRCEALNRYARPVVVYLVSTIAVVALVPVALFIVVAVFAWRVPDRSPRGSRSRRVVVIIPAHNEERVIGRILSDLSQQRYPSHLLEVHVVADHCTDHTAAVAGGSAMVHERTSGAETKGAAIAWLVDRIDIGDDDIVMVFDADAGIGPDVIAAVSDGADSGFRVMQLYLNASNPDESYVSLAGALSQWMSNRLIELPRRNLGMSCNLLGTGFALSGDLSDKLVIADHGLTEDQELSDRLAIEGERIKWLHHVEVNDEKPAAFNVLLQQRARWARGRSQTRRRALQALSTLHGPWTLSRVDRILRIVLPGRTISAAVLVAVAVAGLIWPSVLAFSPFVIITALMLAVVLSIAALFVEGAGIGRIMKIPILALFALLWLPERLINRRSTGWYNTPHKGDVG